MSYVYGTVTRTSNIAWTISLNFKFLPIHNSQGLFLYLPSFQRMSVFSDILINYRYGGITVEYSIWKYNFVEFDISTEKCDIVCEIV